MEVKTKKSVSQFIEQLQGRGVFSRDRIFGRVRQRQHVSRRLVERDLGGRYPADDMYVSIGAQARAHFDDRLRDAAHKI